MASKGDKKLHRPTWNDEQNMPMSKTVKQEHPLPQPPGKECPENNTSMPSEVCKCIEQDPTDDKEVGLTIIMHEKYKKSEDTYTIYGKPNNSVYTTLIKSEDVQNELKKRPKEEMEACIVDFPKIHVNLGMPLKCLPEVPQLYITFIKSKKCQNDEPPYSESINQKCFTFYISKEGKGGKKIVKPKYSTQKYDYLLVYGIKGETVHDALFKDGRFLSWVTENDWMLAIKKSKYGKNTIVDNVLGKEFEVIVKKKKKETPQKGQEQKNKKMTLQQNSNSTEQMDSLGTTQEGTQSTSVDGKSLKPEMAKGASKPISSGTKPKKSKFYTIEEHILKIYNIFTEENNLIRNFFEMELENAGKCGNKLFNLHLEKFGKVTEDAMTTKSFKMLATLVDSVGYIHLSRNGKSITGTCFVFWDRYILTCRHVLSQIIGEEEEQKWAQIISKISFVTFTDENPKDSSQKIGIEPWFEVSSINLDYAVLKLKENEIPKGLFKQKENTELPTDGTVFIIGHPEGEVKKIDICTVISLADREKNCLEVLQNRQEPECNLTNCPDKDYKCIHMFSMKGLNENNLDCEDRLTYDTSFFCGSSGSPVLDVSGRLLAMHAAGFGYNYQGQKQSVIEFGFSINSIHNDMKKNHESWYNLLFPYQQDVEMVNADDSPPHLLYKEDASGALLQSGGEVSGFPRLKPGTTL